MDILELKGLSKSFKSRREKTKKIVLENINLTISEGEIFGLLGLNGAGKTTLIRMISGILMPDKGEITVFGKTFAKDEKFIKKNLGVVLGGDRSFYQKLTANENLTFFGTLYGVSKQKLKENIDKFLKYVGLYLKKDEYVETYSKGMKQRLLIAKALITEPKLLLLDEPTAGIDVEGAKEFWALIHQINRDFKLPVIMTTHYLHEAEQMCTRIGLLRNGSLVASGSLSELKNRFPDSNIITVETSYELDKAIYSKLAEIVDIFKVDVINKNVCYKINFNCRSEVDFILSLLGKESASIRTININQLSLEDIVERYLYKE